jgi:hypothetical protein
VGLLVAVRYATVVLAALVVFIGIPYPAVILASEYDGDYKGMIRCDAMANVGPLAAPISLKVNGTRIVYDRDVMRGNSNVPSGVVERGGVASPQHRRTTHAAVHDQR